MYLTVLFFITILTKLSYLSLDVSLYIFQYDYYKAMPYWDKLNGQERLQVVLRGSNTTWVNFGVKVMLTAVEIMDLSTTDDFVRNITQYLTYLSEDKITEAVDLEMPLV